MRYDRRELKREKVRISVTERERESIKEGKESGSSLFSLRTCSRGPLTRAELQPVALLSHL